MCDAESLPRRFQKSVPLLCLMTLPPKRVLAPARVSASAQEASDGNYHRPLVRRSLLHPDHHPHEILLELLLHGYYDWCPHIWAGTSPPGPSISRYHGAPRCFLHLHRTLLSSHCCAIGHVLVHVQGVWFGPDCFACQTYSKARPTYTMLVDRAHQHAFLTGIEPRLFKLMFENASSEHLANWLRLLLELATDKGETELVSALRNAGAEGSRLHLAVRGGHGMQVTDQLKRGESPDAR